MDTEMVMALLRPHPGKENILETMIRQYAEMLYELGFVTYRPLITFVSKSGLYIALLEWQSPDSVKAATGHPDVIQMKTELEKVCDFLTLSDLPEKDQTFPHFRVVESLSESFYIGRKEDLEYYKQPQINDDIRS